MKGISVGTILFFAILMGGCTSISSIMGAHPGVAKGSDGETLIYNKDKLSFLDHGDSFWHQLLLIKWDESDFTPELTAETFIEVVSEERNFVELNTFQRRAAKKRIIQDLVENKNTETAKLHNGIFVIQGMARFAKYNFDSESYRLKKVIATTDGSMHDLSAPSSNSIRKNISGYFMAPPTPPIIEPIEDMMPLNHIFNRSSDNFLSRLSTPPSKVHVKLSPSEAEELSGFYSDRKLRVAILSEAVDFSDRPVGGLRRTGKSQSVNNDWLVFEHNVLCYIFMNGKQIRTVSWEHSEIEGRSREICQQWIAERPESLRPKKADMRPSFRAFPEGSLTERGKRVRARSVDYF